MQTAVANVFITGATGYVGTAIARALRAAGHSVSALCRSPAAAARAKDAGLNPVLGDLRAPGSWAAVAAEHGAIVHAAFEYRTDGSEADDLDRRTVDVLLAASASGHCRHLVYTSNAFLLADLAGPRGSLVDEAVDISRATRPGSWRLDVEQAVLAATGERRTAVVRLGAVYGGDGGSLPSLFEHAERTRTLEHVGDGENRWSLIHHDDLAALYRAILAHGACGVFHGVDGVPLSIREMMQIVAAAVGPDVVVRGCPAERAPERLPYYASVLEADLAMDTTRARALGWAPRVESFASGAAATYAALYAAAPALAR